MAKAKRDEMKDAAKSGGDDYEFKLPPFDEKAFIRREIQSAKASFWTVGLGIVAGIVSTVVWLIPNTAWWYGWFPIVVAVGALRPLLLRLNFSEEIVAPKALIGSYFMLFFTGLSIWVLAVNFV